LNNRLGATRADRLFSTSRTVSTVEQDDGTHSVRLGEGELPDSVRSLISFAESHPKREETIERAGS